MNEEQLAQLTGLLQQYKANATQRKVELVPAFLAFNEQVSFPPEAYAALNAGLQQIIQQTSQPETPPANPFEASIAALELGYTRDKLIIDLYSQILSSF